MHVSLDSALGRQRRLNSVGESVLQIAPSASAAYSLRSLTGGDPKVVRVRRSSDNAESDFTASGVSSGALLDFVKTEAVTYTSDFSTDTDGWSAVNAALAVSAGALEMTPNSVSTTHHTSEAGLAPVGEKVRITFDVKIPSGQSLVNGFKLVEVSGATIKNVSNQTQGDFVSYSEEFTATSAGILRFFANKDGNVTFAGDDSEKIIIKNIVITNIDENGFVETWYDQSGNSNDAVQATSGNQPKIVDAGSLVEDTNGHPEIKFDGSDTSLLKATFTQGELAQANTIFAIAKLDVAADINRKIYDGGTSAVKRNMLFLSTDGSGEFGFFADDVVSTGVTATTDKNLFSALFDGASSELFINGSSAASGDVGDYPMDGIRIGENFSAGANNWLGQIQEIIVYNANQSAKRSALETNINSHYSIF